MKIAFISETLPPAKTGQATVLYRLLQGLHPRNYCLISLHKWNNDNAKSHQTAQLSGKYYQLAPYFQITRGSRFGLAYLREAINIPLGILLRTRQVTDIIRRERCDAVVACTGDLLDLPTGYLASRQVGVPFYAYIFDHYSYREWSSSMKRFWAKRFEPVLMKGAAGIIVPNEILRDDLRNNYGVEATVIHNSCDIAEYEAQASDAPVMGSDGGIKIVYTGDVYEAHYDAIRNLLVAIESLGRTDIKLHLYTSRPASELADKKISGPVIYHEHHSPSEMPRIQRQADVLFLPLAFDSPYPDLVRTSATTKLGEYLATRRPVLAHAPSDSFIAWYFRKHHCGLVVDECDPAKLAQTIDLVLNDEKLRQRLGMRAWEQAQEDFSITTARSKFMDLVGFGTA